MVSALGVFFFTLMVIAAQVDLTRAEYQGNRLARLRDEGWQFVGDYAYKLATEQGGSLPVRVNFERGRKLCQNMGGDLAVEGIRNNDLRYKAARSVYRGPVWIGLWVGLADKQGDGLWNWIDGQQAKSNDIKWSPLEPNGKQGKKLCGELWGEERRFTMNDMVCGGRRFAMCEQKFIR
ncbi:lectin-like [Clavelina lepadiformis]|uniref:C-type lectin domain-containing protein n=1 Tax=Clavelina lepadiformis TaxID=159417 RepID=A0ABP0GI36_CLALP